MNPMDIPHWVVGDKHIFNQLEAWEEIVKSKREFRFYFHDHVYDRYDWSIEPKQSWDELVHHRCLQLRQKYRKLSLWYSGGRDSHHVLRSFAQNNIPIDELLLLHWKMNPVRTAEYYNWQLPLAKKYKEINPNVKISTIDVDSKVYAKYYDAKKPESKYFSSDDGLYQPSDFEWHTVNLCNIRDSSTGVIVALEKPYLYLKDGKIYHRFIDKVIELYRGSISEFEMFYYAPEMPELYIKQCHILANYIKQNYPNKNQDFFDQFVENPFGQFYSEFCSACGRGPAIDDNEPCNNGKNKYNGSHGLFDKIIDVAKKDNFKSYQIWQDSVNYWTTNMPEAFGKKNYREGGTTGIRSNEKYITDYIRR
tara:strand:+ start:1425 stop:2516 length:1092 start_codon:yes stop_codon:yes gene_type:complete